MLVTMSDKELNRINVIQSVVEKRMRRRDAAHQLALTERQTQRLMNRFRENCRADYCLVNAPVPFIWSALAGQISLISTLFLTDSHFPHHFR